MDLPPYMTTFLTLPLPVSAYNTVGWPILLLGMNGLMRSRCVHLFACVFYRIKRDFTPDPEQVELFYSSRNVEQNVREYGNCFSCCGGGGVCRAVPTGLCEVDSFLDFPSTPKEDI